MGGLGHHSGLYHKINFKFLFPFLALMNSGFFFFVCLFLLYRLIIEVEYWGSPHLISFFFHFYKSCTHIQERVSTSCL